MKIESAIIRCPPESDERNPSQSGALFNFNQIDRDSRSVLIAPPISGPKSNSMAENRKQMALFKKVGSTRMLMNPLESMLTANKIPFVMAEQHERNRLKVLGMDKIGEVGATHYRGDTHTLSVVEFSDGYDIPPMLQTYLMKLGEVQESLMNLTAQGDADYRIIPAMGLYVEQEGPTFSLPFDFNAPLILLVVLFTNQSQSDDELIDFGSKRLIEISTLLEQALQHMGINIE
jgi:hypothetical protein